MDEQPPSKDVLSQAWDDVNGLVEFAYEQGFHEMGYNPLNVIDSALADTFRENDRLRITLRGIQSCSTCEACRGAATLALGGATPEPAVGPDEVLVALKRPEGYEDVHPELVAEDAIRPEWPEYRTIQRAAQPPGDGDANNG